MWRAWFPTILFYCLLGSLWPPMLVHSGGSNIPSWSCEIRSLMFLKYPAFLICPWMWDVIDVGLAKSGMVPYHMLRHISRGNYENHISSCKFYLASYKNCMIVLPPRKRELLDICPLLCGRNISKEISKGKSYTFLWLSSLRLLPCSASWIPLLWAIVSCPCHLPSQPLPCFYISNEIPIYNTTTQPHDLSPQIESGNATTSDFLTTTKAIWCCQHQVRRNECPIFHGCYDFWIFN